MTPFQPDYAAARVVASPNHNERRGPLDAIVLHYTGMPTGDGALARLCSAESQVSCHYFVWPDGRIDQLVPEDRRAWHAGKSFWRGESDLNSRSIGVEIVNPGHEGGLPPYPPAQIAAVIALCRDAMARRAIAAARVLGHSDIAPGRKVDPGERFPWARLARAGVALWTKPRRLRRGPILAEGDASDGVGALQRDLANLGYDLPQTGLYDAPTRTAVASFQLRWRPSKVDGTADPATRATLRDALALASCDDRAPLPRV